MDLKLSRYHVVSDPITFQDASHRVVMATRTGEIVDVDARLWRLLTSGCLAELPQQIIDDLIEIELLVPACENELETVLDRSNQAIEDATTLRIVVQPTASCQLDCVYCGQEHTSSRLCEDHQDALIRRAEARLQDGIYDLISVGWFGAEPLIALHTISSLSHRFMALADTYHCEYSSTIVTNGLRLTPAVAEELLALGVRQAEVTVDGLPKWHDRQRPYKSGRSGFEKTMKNLIELGHSAVSFPVSLRCNVTADSAADVPAFIDLLAELGLQQALGYVYFAAIHDWGNDAKAMSLAAADFAACDVTWQAQLLRLGFAGGSLPAPKPIVCLATSKNGEVVDAHGQVFNCTEVSYVPTYGTPNRYAIGTVDGDVDESKRSILADFNATIARGDVPCRECNLLPVCGGSCPKAWNEGEVACPPWKWHLPQRLVLEFARLQAGPVERAAAKPLSEVFDRLNEVIDEAHREGAAPVAVSIRPKPAERVLA